ncbi:hypothetical protein [Ralstonia sp. Ralssp135]|uniref:hypothetical protein n=1 Tax=Ralstonia sp. Ralssp135 TaxID=3243016 RepID=UPI0039B0E308
MTIDLHATFEKYNDDYLNFEAVENKRSQRADLHAFLLLDELQPAGGDIITASYHDEFYLDTDCDELAKVITEEQVRELARCGVRYDGDDNALCMFA